MTCVNVRSSGDFHALLTMDSRRSDDGAAIPEDEEGILSNETERQDAAYKRGWVLTTDNGQRKFKIYHYWGDPTWFVHLLLDSISF